MKHSKICMAFAAVLVTSCASSQKEPDGPAERAGEKVDEAAEDTKDAAEDAGDKIEQKTDEAEDKVD